MNKCLLSFCPEGITETNKLLLAAAHVVRDRLGERVLPPKGREKKQPFWKRRIEDKVKELRKDIFHLAEMLKGTKLKSKIMDELNRKFPLLKKKGLNVYRRNSNRGSETRQPKFKDSKKDVIDTIRIEHSAITRGSSIGIYRHRRVPIWKHLKPI